MKDRVYIWRDTVREVLPRMPEQFTSVDVLEAVETDEPRALNYIAMALRYLERQSIVKVVGRVRQRWLWARRDETAEGVK